jgi:uncharacterized protein YoxC
MVYILSVFLFITSLSVVYLYVRVYELVCNYAKLKQTHEYLGKEYEGLCSTTGGIIQDFNKLSKKVEELEGKLKKYEDAADKVSKLQSISPRLARGAYRA